MLRGKRGGAVERYRLSFRIGELYPHIAADRHRPGELDGGRDIVAICGRGCEIVVYSLKPRHLLAAKTHDGIADKRDRLGRESSYVVRYIHVRSIVENRNVDCRRRRRICAASPVRGVAEIAASADPDIRRIGTERREYGLPVGKERRIRDGNPGEIGLRKRRVPCQLQNLARPGLGRERTEVDRDCALGGERE